MDRQRKIKRLLTCATALLLVKKRQRKQKKKVWTKSWLKERTENENFISISKESTLNPNNDDFHNYLRMPPSIFHDLLEKIRPIIERQDTRLRRAISPALRLEATLRFLATGESYASLQHRTRISRHSLGSIIPETCDAIYRVLEDDYIKTQTTQEEWRAEAKDFEEKWDFPHCVGAVGGKHIMITPPPGSGSYYYNYKCTHSIVLVAVSNAKYEFTYVDIGTSGNVSEEGVWSSCRLRHVFESDHAQLPDSCTLSNSSRELPYVLVADDAFPLTKYTLKPYSFKNQNDEQRIFSYRLSRARSVIDNAFGILSSKFRVLHKPINLHPHKVTKIALACIALHNMLLKVAREQYVRTGMVDQEDLAAGTISPGDWRQHKQLLELQPVADTASEEALNIRASFMHYFNNEGAVPWQMRMCGVK